MLLRQRTSSVSEAGVHSWMASVRRRGEKHSSPGPLHKLGPILGCTPRSISTYIRMAEEEEILERVQRHLPKTRKAHEFRFRTEYWKILSDGPP